MQYAVRSTFRKALSILAPAERLTPVEWAMRNLWLTRSTSARPGRFKPWPWQVDPINAIIDERLSAGVLLWPSQLLGKSTVINCVLGYCIAHSPSSILLIHPSVESAETFSKNKLTPLILDSPALSQLVLEEELNFRRKGAGASTVSLKRFPGGSLILVGANAPTGLRSHSCKRIFADEVSAFPLTVSGDEGDPLSMAKMRALTFSDSFEMISSTPTLVGSCRITLEIEDTDKRVWSLLCERCNQWFYPRWSDIEWRKLKRDGKTIEHYPETAAMKCPTCQTLYDEESRHRMTLSGKWIVTNPAVTNRAGFIANGLISVQAPQRGYASLLHQFADSYLKSVRRGTYFVRSFQNSVLSEAYEIRAEVPVETNVLCDRRETYPETDDGEIIVPMKVAVLAVGVDIQKNRLEAECVGFADSGETFAIEYKIFPGNTELRDVYQRLDEWVRKKYKHESGWIIWPEVVCVDSAYRTEAAYRYTKSCVGRRVHACRGDRGWAPLGSNWINRSNNEDMKDHLWIMKKDGAIESIYSRLQLEIKGDGYQHFPDNINSGYDATYFKQLTSQVLKVSPSGQRYYTVPSTDTRDEALAVRVLAEAAVATLPPIDFEEIARRFAGPPPAGMSWNNATPAPTPEAEEESPVVAEFLKMINMPVKKGWIRDIS